MNLRPIIDDIASQADEFLADCTDRTQARAGISEFLSLEHPRLQAADRKTVTDHVMALLEQEDFFVTRFVVSFDADQDSTEGGED